MYFKIMICLDVTVFDLLIVQLLLVNEMKAIVLAFSLF